MKNIQEILRETGVEIPEDKQKAFDAAFLENYKTVAETEKLRAARDNYKDQLETAQNALKEFEGIDVGELQKKIDGLNTELEKKDSEYQTKIADLEFSAALDGAIAKSGARNAKAVRALLDLDSLKTSQNRDADIAAAVQAVKDEEGYLFGADEPIDSAVRETGGSSGGRFDALRAAMGLPAAENKK